MNKNITESFLERLFKAQHDLIKHSYNTCMEGWKLQRGDITNYNVSNDQYWSLFNHVFSTSCKKTNTYKFGFLKSILDNLFNAEELNNGSFLSFYDIFTKFTANYWNLVVHDKILQSTYNGKNKYSKLEIILMNEVKNNPILENLDFESIDEKTFSRITKEVTTQCKRFVVGALYGDLEGCVYSFDLKGKGIIIAPRAYEFLLKYKVTLEKLNYFAWAKFIETVNPPENTMQLLDVLELATPKRKDLTPYKDFLYHEHHDTNCFYCGRPLSRAIDTDHFVPWNFVKDDKLWNMVLACPHCNRSKNDKLPSRELIYKIEQRNKEIILLDNPLVKRDMHSYSDDILEKMWNYADMSGYRPYII